MVTDKIVGFIAKDLHPLSIVDGVGFQEMVSCIEPKYKIPSRTHITQRSAICCYYYRLMGQPSYPNISYYDCALHHRTVNDGKQGTANSRDARASHYYKYFRKNDKSW